MLNFPFNFVYTSVEAEKKWNLKEGTIRSACIRGKLKKYIGHGVKQTGKTWLVTKWIMEKEYGSINNESEEKEVGTTVTDYYFINMFKTTEESINELGEKYGVTNVFEELKHAEETEEFNKFDQVKIGLFMQEAEEILYDNDINAKKTKFDFMKIGSDIYVDIDEKTHELIKPALAKANFELKPTHF